MKKPTKKPDPVPWEVMLSGMPPVPLYGVRGKKSRHIARRRVVVNFCLYPQDLERLDDLCGGKPRMRSTVIRHLIRATKKISGMDLTISQMLDERLSEFSRAMGTRGSR